MSLEELGLQIVDRWIELRDIEAGEEALPYTSGHYGPVYTYTKESVGQKKILKDLTKGLAGKLISEGNLNFDFIATNESGGMVPGWQFSLDLDDKIRRELPYVYVRRSGKITGFMKNPLIKRGMNGLIFEDAVNFGSTMIKAADLLRKKGYVINRGACFLYYDHPVGIENLAEVGINLTCLFTLTQLLDIAEANGRFNPRVIADCREFLKNPDKWNRDRGLK